MSSSDPFQLHRFVDAQHGIYEQALAEIRRGLKASHWMWFIFPQLDGLGMSEKSRHFAIRSLDEARAYLQHTELGPRLLECTQAALAIENRSALQVFGEPDHRKLQSSATLFSLVHPAFDDLLKKYFEGKKDAQTLRLLGLL